MKKIYLIDGNSFLYRFFYAIKLYSDGFPTNAIYGFARLLISLKNEENLVICFDSKEKTFRKELFDDYKKQRPKIPDELKIQINPTKELIQDFGVKLLTVPGFEADDIIATIAEKFKKDYEIIIITQDKDLHQLIDENVYIYDPVKNIKYDYQKSFEKFGVSPDKLSDLLALCGDASDGIPGIFSIGEKRAIKLLEEFGSIDGLINNLDKLPEKLRSVINKDQLKLYKTLTLLDRNIDIAISLKDIKKLEPDIAAIKKIFEKYNFKTLIPKLDYDHSDTKPKIILPKNTKNITNDTNDTNGLIQLAAYLIYSESGGDIEKCAKFIDKSLYENTRNLDYKEKIAYLEPIFLDLIKKLDLEFLLFEVELPLKKILLKMQKDGIGVDINKLKSFKEILSTRIKEKEIQLEKIIGKCNLNSPKELQIALFEKLSLKPTKKIKTGFSTDSETLESLNHPVSNLIIDYRNLKKLLSTYIEPLINLSDSSNRVHTTFNQTLTSTGRLSSSNPNMQNLPLENQFINIRESIVPKKGYSLICADYSQIELRILAELSKDPTLVAIFKNNEDVHSQTAAELFNILPNMVDNHLRKIAKTINFGIIYGMGSLSLAKTLSIQPKMAAEYIDKYLKRFALAKEFIENTIKETKNLGYTQTYFKRRRYFPNINSKNKRIAEFEKRACVNAKIQGTAADIIKIAMVKLDKELRDFNASIVLQIHDELLIECDDREIEQVKSIVKNSMENAVNFDVLLKVNIGVGKNWYESKA